MMAKTLKIIHGPSLFALVSLVLGGWVHRNLPEIKQSSLNPPVYQLTPQFFKLITVGHWPAAVEGLWITLIQKVGLHPIPEGALDSSVHFYDLATDLDPYFFELYSQAGVVFSILSNRPQQAAAILKKGQSAHQGVVQTALNRYPYFRENYWRNPHMVYIQLGYVQAFELQDWASARVTFLAAAELSSSPAYLQTLKALIQSEGSEGILAERVLTSLIQTTDDAIVKKRYQEKLAEVQAQNRSKQKGVH